MIFGKKSMAILLDNRENNPGQSANDEKERAKQSKEISKLWVGKAISKELEENLDVEFEAHIRNPPRSYFIGRQYPQETAASIECQMRCLNSLQQSRTL